MRMAIGLIQSSLFLTVRSVSFCQTCGNVTTGIGLAVLAFDQGYPPPEGTNVGCSGATSLFAAGSLLAILFSSVYMLLA